MSQKCGKDLCHSASKTRIHAYLYTCMQLNAGKNRSDLGLVPPRENRVDAFGQESLHCCTLLSGNDFEGGLNFGGKMPPYQDAT